MKVCDLKVDLSNVYNKCSKFIAEITNRASIEEQQVKDLILKYGQEITEDSEADTAEDSK